jgi:hypothetical protein
VSEERSRIVRFLEAEAHKLLTEANRPTVHPDLNDDALAAFKLLNREHAIFGRAFKAAAEMIRIEMDRTPPAEPIRR